MTGKRTWELEQGLFAYFYAKDASETKSLRDIAELLKKEYGKIVTAPTVGNMVAAIAEGLATDAQIKDAYERFKAEMKQAKYFFRINAKGDIESPYETVRRKAEQIKAQKGFYTPYLMNALHRGEKFWLYTGRKKPEDWTQDEFTRYLGTIGAGSKYSVSVACRQFSKNLKDIDDMTRGLKSKARMPTVLKVREFPKIFRQLVAKALELTPIDKRADMEFVLRVKPATGMRTGKRRTRQGMWGTKVGPPEPAPLVKGTASHIQVIGNSLVWRVLEKQGEEWDITFLTDDLRSYIINFVKGKKHGEWLIDSLSYETANSILAQACEAIGIEKLELHDMRKIFVSFLVRAGIPLEKAISLNVGWKDIATAYKHYLALADLGEKEEEYKRKLGSLLATGEGASA